MHRNRCGMSDLNDNNFSIKMVYYKTSNNNYTLIESQRDLINLIDSWRWKLRSMIYLFELLSSIIKLETELMRELRICSKIFDYRTVQRENNRRTMPLRTMDRS